MWGFVTIEGDKRGQENLDQGEKLSGAVPDLSQSSLPLNEISIDQGEAHTAVLDRQTSLTLLGSLAGADRIQREAEASSLVCKILGDTEYGIEIAGGYLAHHPEIAVSELLSKIQEKMSQVGGGRSGSSLEGNLEESSSVLESTYALLECSWEKLDSPTQEIAIFIGHLPPHTDIAWTVVELMKQIELEENSETDSVNLINLDRSKEKLIHLNLLKPVEDEKYSMHLNIRKFFLDKASNLEV
ncbi:MAG: hypothetical protein KME15_16410 [Drouetiella hepatica Uher 2000/2452]|jgi:hypothetical protein|uniref:Uncharacterized protein n=1 Tax=Drouetiella hepatica Uher 2000/2452 TaxID=904376 RepID=A0A951UNX8_9CYAN|nr:hypothetical protein [Drouetiella hepatica Uher 2000/2452]